MKKRSIVTFTLLLTIIITSFIIFSIFRNKYDFNPDNRASYINMMYNIAVIESENNIEGNELPISYNEQKKSYLSFVSVLKKDDSLLSTLSVIQVAKLITIDSYMGGIYHDFFLERLQLYKNEKKVWNVYIYDYAPESWTISNVAYTAYSIEKMKNAINSDELAELEVMNGVINEYNRSLAEGWYAEAEDESEKREIQSMYTEILFALFYTNNIESCDLDILRSLHGDSAKKVSDLQSPSEMFEVQYVRQLEIEALTEYGKCEFEGLSTELFAELNTKEQIVESRPEEWTALVIYLEQGGKVSENKFYLSHINEWIDQYFGESIVKFCHRGRFQ